MRIDPKSVALGLLKTATPVLFFTGSPGAGKTSMAGACARVLAGHGRQVLLVGAQAPSTPQPPGVQVTCGSGPAAIAGLLAQDWPAVDYCIFDVDLPALVQAWRTQPEALPDLHRHDALLVLADPWRTTVVLVTRPDGEALRQTARLHQDLVALEVRRQWLLVNGLPHEAAAPLPAALRSLPRDRVTLQHDTPTPAPP